VNEQELLHTVTQKIKEQLFIPFFRSHLDEPTIDDTKLQFIIRIFTASEHTQEEIIHYSTAVMLMQIALDTHDLVTLSTDEDTASTLFTRQLLILAGDYYTGLYYQMLADYENMHLINEVASAVKEINELKISFHYEKTEKKQVIDLKRKVSILLLLRLCEAFQLEQLRNEIVNFYEKGTI